MATPSDFDAQPSGDSGGRDGGFPMLRALVVLVVFVGVTVLVLSDIHPAATKTASASTAASTTTTTTTTRPTHSATTTTTIPPNKVPVVVANASGVTGAAAKISSQLATGGWDLLAPVNATTEVTTSSVYFVAGFQSEAEIIASSLHLSASAVAPYTTAVPISSIGTADVVVVAGPDLADKTAGAAATTTTTAAAAATTTTAG